MSVLRRNYVVSAKTWFLLVLLPMVIACNEGATQRTSGSVSTVDTIDASADTEWQRLTASGTGLQRGHDEAYFVYLMKQVELANARRRELGIRFWKSFPKDTRRYDWLLLTVHMPPRYPVDLDDWARGEASLHPNASVVDVDSIRRWEQQYRQMREDFWFSQFVTEQQRRFLWFGELDQQFMRHAESRARGEEADIEIYLDQIVGFLERFPEALSETDVEEFAWISGAVAARPVLARDNPLGLTDEMLERYLLQLAQSENREAVNTFDYLADHLKRRQHANMSETESANSALSEDWESLPSWPSDKPSTYVGRVVFYHDKLVNLHKQRAIGLMLWGQSQSLLEDRVRWLRGTLWSNPHYPKAFVDCIRYLASNSPHQCSQDDRALDEWDVIYKRLRNETWQDSNLSMEERANLRSHEVWANLWRAQYEWQARGAKDRVDIVLQEIHELYKAFNNPKRFAEGSATVFAGIVLREPREFGLTDKELLEFFSPMLDYDDVSLRSMALAATSMISLRSQPFEFQAFQMSGDSFDLKELHGKIVLVDHWATTCSSCIAAMPRIHDIYERYKDRGFEVVSIAYDGTSQRKRIERIEKELGLTWTTLDGEGQWEEISEKYGYQGFHQYMLLNRDGTLHAGTGEVDMGRNLEALLEEMLAGEAAEKEAAAVH